MTEEYATRKELNGVGTRISLIELLTPEVKRNKEDVQALFNFQEKNIEQHSEIKTMIGKIETGIQKTVNTLVWKVVAVVSIPSIILAVQIFVK